MNSKANYKKKVIESRISWYLGELGIAEENNENFKLDPQMTYHFYKQIDETKCLLVIVYDGEYNNDLWDSISLDIANPNLKKHFEKEDLEINVLLLSSSVNIDFKDMKNIKNKLCKAINDGIKTTTNKSGVKKEKNKIGVKKGNIYLDYFFPMEKTEYKIKVVDLFGYNCVNKSLKREEEKIEIFDGHIFVADLKDLQEIYADVGPDLFKKNVRVGIKDTMDVDKNILQTLKDNPEDFWFFNNGITMLVDSKYLTVKDTNTLSLSKDECVDLPFSIVNGAQTITSSYHHFKSENPGNENKKNAKVILKIIERLNVNLQNDKDKAAALDTKKIDDIQKVTSSFEIKISVALNRQKPINKGDIAYFTLDVQMVNDPDFFDDEKYRFEIVRRGEVDSEKNRTYKLIDLIRVIYATYRNDPGGARSKSENTLLAITESPKDGGEDLIRLKEKIFDFCDEFKNGEKKYASTILKPIVILMEMEKLIDKKFKELLKSYEFEFLKYGKYLMLNLFFRNYLFKYIEIKGIKDIAIDKLDKQFTDFEQNYANEDLMKIINKEFVEKLNEKWLEIKSRVDNSIQKLDSNHFKTTKKGELEELFKIFN